MKAIVFCAGYGTRMRPFTDLLPKPAMPFFNRPLIAHALRWLAGYGVDECVINLHHLGGIMRATAEAACPPGMRLVFSEEAEILGTGGGLVAARRHFHGEPEVIAVNGDVFTELDLSIPLAAHRAHRPAATLALNADPANEALFGVGVDADSRITDFWGEPQNKRASARYVFTGVHIFSPEQVLDRLPAEGFACVKEKGWLPMLRDAVPLRGAVVGGPWFDVGTPERYLQAHRGMMHAAGRLSGLPERATGVWSADPLPSGLTVEAPVVIGANLTLEGPATLGPGAVLGENVTLTSSAHAESAVIWSEAHIEGMLKNDVV